MKINFTIIITICFVGLFFSGCTENPPSMNDGEGKLVLFSFWDSSSTEGVSKIAPLSNAKVILVSEYGTMIRGTNDEGKIELSNIPASTYDISISMPHPYDNNIIISASCRAVEIKTSTTAVDTLYGKPVSSFGISINELYTVGPANSVFYFYDQFVELYNSSDETKYLDGMIITRMSGNGDGKGPGADEDDDDDIDGVTYVFKFPGSPGEKNYPFQPQTFIVIASDAVDHSKSCTGAANLSMANWECYNQYSPEDIDNPSVPNLLNIRPEKTADFLISLTSDVIVLTSGEDSTWEDGFDISTIIDGVEYQASSKTLKTLDNNIDRSYVLSPGNYSGKSMQRREPGFDTNDGLLDWEIISKPTPGYQK